ncbi:MAG: type II toxin-antitoxin system VapC family toxin [Candidatus Thorarchaeota archaeon]
MKALYFEPSALFKGYYEEVGSEIVDFALRQLKAEVLVGLTSLWSLGEILRAFRKKVLAKTLPEKAAREAYEYFLADIREFEQDQKITILPITRVDIQALHPYIWNHNLFVSDALHVHSAVKAGATAFLAEDRHFRRFSKIETLKVVDPTVPESQDILQQLIQ